MKYAFIIGSNAFIVPQGIISYADKNGSKEILRINSIYHTNKPGSALSIDLNINDTTGAPIKIAANKVEGNTNFKVIEEQDSIQILKTDGSSVIHIQQLDNDTAMDLEHNITAELEINSPIAVIRIFGDFKAEGLNISAENEKLFINDNGYATSAMTGKSQLEFTASGIVL